MAVNTTEQGIKKQYKKLDPCTRQINKFKDVSFPVMLTAKINVRKLLPRQKSCQKFVARINVLRCEVNISYF